MKKSTLIALIVAIVYSLVPLIFLYFESVEIPNWLSFFFYPGMILPLLLSWGAEFNLFGFIFGQIITFFIFFFILKTIFNSIELAIQKRKT